MRCNWVHIYIYIKRTFDNFYLNDVSSSFNIITDKNQLL